MLKSKKISKPLFKSDCWNKIYKFREKNLVFTNWISILCYRYFKYIFFVILFVIFITLVVIDTYNTPIRLRSLLGIVILLGIGYTFSKHRTEVNCCYLKSLIEWNCDYNFVNCGFNCTCAQNYIIYYWGDFERFEITPVRFIVYTQKPLLQIEYCN